MGHCLISRQECPDQRNRNQVEVNTQIAYRYQAEKQAKQQYKSFQIIRGWI